MAPGLFHKSIKADPKRKLTNELCTVKVKNRHLIPSATETFHSDLNMSF